MLCIVQGTWQHICCCSSDVGSWCSRLLVRLVGLGLWPQAGRPNLALLLQALDVERVVASVELALL